MLDWYEATGTKRPRSPVGNEPAQGERAREQVGGTKGVLLIFRDRRGAERRSREEAEEGQGGRGRRWWW